MGKQVYEQIKKTLSDDPHVYVAKYKGDRACAISYTFDDGLAEHSTVAALSWRNVVLEVLSGYAAIIRNKVHLQRYLE